MMADNKFLVDNFGYILKLRYWSITVKLVPKIDTNWTAVTLTSTSYVHGLALTVEGGWLFLHRETLSDVLSSVLV